MSIAFHDGIFLIHLSRFSQLCEQISIDENGAAANCIIWMTGSDAPVYWSNALDRSFGLTA